MQPGRSPDADERAAQRAREREGAHEEAPATRGRGVVWLYFSTDLTRNPEAARLRDLRAYSAERDSVSQKSCRQKISCTGSKPPGRPSGCATSPVDVWTVPLTTMSPGLGSPDPPVVPSPDPPVVPLSTFEIVMRGLVGAPLPSDLLRTGGG